MDRNISFSRVQGVYDMAVWIGIKLCVSCSGLMELSSGRKLDLNLDGGLRAFKANFTIIQGNTNRETVT